LSLHTAEVRVGDGEFVARMTEMRVWLDSRRFEPATFRYANVDRAVVVRVDFIIEAEAHAFAQEFQGRILR
jgi:hypothetical protein